MTNKTLSVSIHHTWQHRDSASIALEFEVPLVGITAIYGQSGAGKSTCLNVISGLEKSIRSKIKFGDTIWQSDNTFVKAEHRHIGYVFQDSVLFPHLTIDANLNYAHSRSRTNTAELDKSEIYNTLEIESLFNQYPKNLSGGEKQRVTIARSLVSCPNLLLMDEPLSSIDQARKNIILPFIKNYSHQKGIPVLYVTHSIQEILNFADRVIIFDQGKVTSQGCVETVFSRYQNQNEVGAIIHGHIDNPNQKDELVEISVGNQTIWAHFEQPFTGPVNLKILAKDISLSLTRHHNTSILNWLKVKVIEIVPSTSRASSIVTIQFGSQTLYSEVTNRSIAYLNIRTGMEVWAQVKAVSVAS